MIPYANYKYGKLSILLFFLAFPTLLLLLLSDGLNFSPNLAVHIYCMSFFAYLHNFLNYEQITSRQKNKFRSCNLSQFFDCSFCPHIIMIQSQFEASLITKIYNQSFYKLRHHLCWCCGWKFPINSLNIISGNKWFSMEQFLCSCFRAGVKAINSELMYYFWLEN